jgi:hypothetical protein
MQQWNIEYSVPKADDGLILSFLVSGNPIKTDLIPPSPIFQYSSIPIPHEIHLRHKQSSPT